MKTFIKMLFLVFCADAAIWCAGGVIGIISPDECWGWNCEVVQCPENYAVRVTEDYYLPCNNWNDFFEKEEIAVLMKRNK